MPARQLHEYVQRLLPLVDEIEKLAPALAHEGPNAEYPWADPSGAIHVPALFHFPATIQLKQPAGRKLFSLTRLLLDRFYILFIPKHK